MFHTRRSFSLASPLNTSQNQRILFQSKYYPLKYNQTAKTVLPFLNIHGSDPTWLSVVCCSDEQLPGSAEMCAQQSWRQAEPLVGWILLWTFGYIILRRPDRYRRVSTSTLLTAHIFRCASISRSGSVTHSLTHSVTHSRYEILQ